MDHEPTFQVDGMAHPVSVNASHQEITAAFHKDLNADALSTDEHVNAVGWMRTYTGKRVTPLDLKPEMVDITDIAHALSRIGRFGGHAAGFISVASHSMAVTRLVAEQTDDPRMQLTALLHDASEAYIGDIIRPIKKHPMLADILHDAEERVHAVVAQVFGTHYPHPDLVVQADDARLAWEMENIRDLDTHVTDINEDRIDFILHFGALRRLINQGL